MTSISDDLTHAAALAGSSPPAEFPRALALPAAGYQVAQFVAHRASACVGADYSNLALLEPTGDKLRVFHSAFLDDEIAERYADVAVDAPFPLAAAVREGNAVFLSDLEAYRTQFPAILADTVAAGVQATASLPLHRADGSPLGALGFAWTEPTAFDRKLEAALTAVAHLCVETIERAERYDAEHELVAELQTRLLGEIPALAGIETAARYLPANEVPAVGGDWYEGLLLGDAKIGLVVGDVTGHGIVAAADMALIRGMIGALLHSGIPAADVFSEVSAVVAQRTGLLLATAVLAIVDLEAAKVTYSSAGHPPPLLRLPDGQVRTLDTANGPMLGLDERGRNAETVPFPVGAQLLMYTDGLVESRNQPFYVGIERAVHHLTNMPRRVPPNEVVDSLLTALLDGTKAKDDIAVLVAEHSS